MNLDRIIAAGWVPVNRTKPAGLYFAKAGDGRILSAEHVLQELDMMTFLGGPAEQVANGLGLRRAPKFLRVVRKEGSWDALDQIEDRVEFNEDVHVYRLVENHGSIHINRRDKHGRHNGGTFVMATYQYLDPQPDQATMRSNRLWQAWATEQAAKEKADAGSK